MSSRRQSSFFYGSINRQMHRVANDHQHHLRQAWIDRVLDLLDNDNLIGKAADVIDIEDGLLLECNIAPMVWDDPRIAYRRQQLASNNVDVELVDHEHTIAGKTFKRAQIKVVF